MTNDVSQEAAGRELDALVAEHVMGSFIIARGEMLDEAVRVWKDQPQCTEFLRGFHAHRDGPAIVCYQIFPKYSTDISAAWEVVEKLSPQNRPHAGHIVCVNAPDGDGYPWCVEWYDGKETLDAALGETAPLAICRAALLAVGVGAPAGEPE